MEPLAGSEVFVIVSDVGLNGVVLHGVYSALPSKQDVEQIQKEMVHTTGYRFTWVTPMQMDAPIEIWC